MKKLNKFCAAFIICAFAITLISCAENRVDKLLDELESLIDRMDKALKAEKPSKEEILSIENESINFQELYFKMSTIKDSEVTESQKRRILGIMKKGESLSHDKNYYILERLRRQNQMRY